MTGISPDRDVMRQVMARRATVKHLGQEMMERWNAQVIATVVPDRLLVWNPAEGWDPLCHFLEVDVPSEPLPNLNDTAAFKEGIIGGSLSTLNAWWDQRERPTSGLHGASLEEEAAST